MIEVDVNHLLMKFTEEQFNAFIEWFVQYNNIGAIDVDVTTGILKFECDADAIFFKLVWL